ncbi:hypothetical protein EVAR_46815_1 [Eumeta japonica]|uniref:Uncharacterized protein n=1 Tax=Eumeta variegata TaxID=151549 RepID=A0A4C1XDV9_EUMVA|nr:hypothetical protein EVAR_46815_1 [Eumeta japonica]
MRNDFDPIPVLSRQLSPLALRTNDEVIHAQRNTPLLILHRVYRGECLENLFNLIPLAKSRHHSACHKCRQYHLNGWRSITVYYQHKMTLSVRAASAPEYLSTRLKTKSRELTASRRDGAGETCTYRF